MLNKYILAVGIALYVLFQVQPLHGQTNQEIYFYDDFEDGDAVGWDLSEGWSIVASSGNHVLKCQGSGCHQAYRGEIDWPVNRFSARINMISGNIQFRFRAFEQPHCYILAINESEINFSRNLAEGERWLFQQHGSISYNAWHAVEIIAENDTLILTIDGLTVFKVKDENVLETGKIGFLAQDAEMLIDDVQVEGTPYINPQPEAATVGSVKAKPRYALPGGWVQINAYLSDEGNNVSKIQAEIKAPNEAVIATLELHDDGNHGDGEADDDVFGNTWQATSGQNDYWIDVTVPNGETKKNAGYFTVTQIKPDFNIYFGNLHSHTSYSDGVGTPEDAFTYARDVAGIDFLAVTDHHYGPDTTQYEDTRQTADNLTEDGVFVAIAGFEWTSSNHLTVYDAAEIFDIHDGDFDDYYTQLAARGLTGHLCHPASGSLNQYRYSYVGDMVLNATELRGASYENVYIGMLNSGWHIGTDGSTDDHTWTWGDGPHWTAALAPTLTKFDLMDAKNNCRTYFTSDRNLELRFSSGNYIMGESFDDNDEIHFTIDIKDNDENDNIEKIELFCDGQVIGRTYIEQADYTWNTMIIPRNGNHHYFAKLSQHDGDKVWSGPIWVNSISQLPPTPLTLSPFENFVLSDLSPTFRWSEPQGSELFTLQYALSPDFPEEESTVTINHISGSSYTLGSLLENHHSYYWRVAAENQNNPCSYSASCKFYTDVEAIFASDTEIQLTNNTETNCRAAMLEDSNGLIWLFFNSLRTGNYDIFYKTSNDGCKTWSEEIQLTFNGSPDVTPRVCEDAQGNIWVVWYANRDGNYEIYYNIYNGNNWLGEVNFSQNESLDYSPSIIRTNDDKLWLVWSSDREEGNVELFYSIYDGSVWSIPTRITQNGETDHYPDIAQDSKGNIHLVWTLSNSETYNDEIYYSTYNGASWSMQENITNTPTPAYEWYPSITQTWDGSLWVAYERLNESILFKCLTNGKWTTENALPVTTSLNNWPYLVQLSDEHVWIVYHSMRNGTQDIFAQRSSVANPSSVEEATESPIPQGYRLYANFPNPFNPTTTIEYNLPEPAFVSLTLYNLRGQVIKKLVDAEKNRGQHKAVWDCTDVSGRKVASGIYIYRIEAQSKGYRFIQSHKMILSK